MFKISIYGCAMFKKLVCQWVNNIQELSGSTKYIKWRKKGLSA